MNQDHDLIRMVNDIARNLAVYPEPEAVTAIAGHIREFWDPRMRARLQTLVKAGDSGLSPLALTAVHQLFASIGTV